VFSPNVVFILTPKQANELYGHNKEHVPCVCRQNTEEDSLLYSPIGVQNETVFVFGYIFSPYLAFETRPQSGYFLSFFTRM